MCALQILFFIFLLAKTCNLSGTSHRNNACRKLSSYPMADNSPHCFYNEDVFSDIVSVFCLFPHLKSIIFKLWKGLNMINE